MFAYRLISGNSLLTPRSFCPYCKHIIAWYDNIPVLSWVLLSAQCRNCKKQISWLYPFIEIITPVFLFSLYKLTPSQFFPAYFLFFSALLVSIRTDFETMLISRIVSLGVIPVMLLASALGFLPISFVASIIGCCTGYLFLLLISKSFYAITGKQGLGQGDIELIAFIGSCIGIEGWWFSLLLGSIVGSIAGTLYILLFAQQKENIRTIKIPFGPFLALGAMIFVLAQRELFLFL